MEAAPEFIFGALALLSCGVGGLVLENHLPMGAPALSLLLTLPVWAFSVLRLLRARSRQTSGEPADAIGKGQSTAAGIQDKPGQRSPSWRFAINYSGLSACFIVLALWLPHFVAGVYHLDTLRAGLVALAWIAPAVLFRGFADSLVHRFSAQRMMYCSLIGLLVATFLLSYPPSHYQIHGISRDIVFSLVPGLPVFTVLMVILGLFLTLGQAALSGHLGHCYPQQRIITNAMAGIAGASVAVPVILTSAIVSDFSGIWHSSFMILFLMTLAMLVRMHLSILRTERRATSGK